ncbi:MAG: hypothetical protein L6Q92_14780 [Phycisphaerae bacterium]|nr:hypothetical protein [Phycisphaerae bacterium]
MPNRSLNLQSILVVALATGCADGGTPSSTVQEPTRAHDRELHEEVRSQDPGIVQEALDAIVAELRLSARCNGGESIQVAMRRSPDEPSTIELVYRVGGELRVYRLGHVQPDGVVLLADDLSFSDWETRYSMKPIDADRATRGLGPVRARRAERAFERIIPPPCNAPWRG